MLDAWKNHNSLEYKAPYFTSEMRREAGGGGETDQCARETISLSSPLAHWNFNVREVRMEWGNCTEEKVVQKAIY